MAKPTGGLLAFGASGTIAKVAVYSSWRGRAYVRRHVVPHNPRSSAQTVTRSIFTYLSWLWKDLPADVQAPWTLLAKGRPLTNRNAFIKQNLPLIRGQTDNQAMRVLTQANGGPGVCAIEGTDGANSVALTAFPPETPADWTLTGVVMVVVQQTNTYGQDIGQDPQSVTIASPGPYTHTFSGLVSGVGILAQASAVYTKPDGSKAYSVADSATLLPT